MIEEKIDFIFILLFYKSNYIYLDNENLKMLVYNLNLEIFGKRSLVNGEFFCVYVVFIESFVNKINRLFVSGMVE